MKTCFIFNPHSGRNRRRPRLGAAIDDFIAASSLDAKRVTTDGPGHATQLAREAVMAGCEAVVAVGGDGTMNEVAQGLVHSPAALALVPCGSGNGLARHLGLPRSPLAALRLASGVDARIAAIDTGLANGFPFFNVMGLGLDAEVSRRFNGLTRRGLLAYLRVACSLLNKPRVEPCRISAPGRVEYLDVLLVAVANSDQYGNHAKIAPGARVDDGRLELIAVQAVGLTAMPALAARLFLGNLEQSPHVIRLSGPRFSVERQSPGFIHTDGETHSTAARVEIVVQPRSLRVIIPARSSAVTSLDFQDTGPARFTLQFP